VYFQTATMRPEVLGEYERLRADLETGFSASLLLDRSACVGPLPARPDLVDFDGTEFARWGFATFGPSLLPGHNHFALLRAYLAEPEHDWYWWVEYDVRYTGSWRRLFSACAPLGADFLGCHLRREVDEPCWHFWNSLRHPKLATPPERLRSLNVAARFSRRALALLCEAHAGGWAGHHEVLVPTLLHAAGLELADLGGDGPFVPRGFRNRFYTSYSTWDGSLHVLGTVRYRPARPAAGLRRNKLYHPVKPDGTFSVAARRDLLRDGVRELGRHLKWRWRRLRGRPGAELPR
jgi:hypothetical protein